MFERLFEKLSDITTKTWSKRIEDLSKNAILHLQGEKSNPGSQYILKDEREISKMAKSLPKLENTILLKSDLEKYAGHWAAHLKLIADFLKPGEGVWWKQTEDCIEFFDGPDEPSFRQEGPQLHHFRSTSITKEQELLDVCWNQFSEDKVKVPATKLRDGSGKWQRPPTCCSVESVEDSGSDQHNCSEPQTHTKDLPDCDDEPAEDDDNMAEDNGQSNMLVEPISCTSSEQPQAENETEADEESLPQEPPLKRHKSDTLVTKTAKALQHVLGTCEEVLKYDKLRQNVAKNPKSRYHIERYETHLVKIQLLTLKAYK